MYVYMQSFQLLLKKYDNIQLLCTILSLHKKGTSSILLLFTTSAHLVCDHIVCNCASLQAFLLKSETSQAGLLKIFLVNIS